MNASRLAVHNVEDENELHDYRASLRLHDLSQVTQLLRPREQQNKPPPFRTYRHHETPRTLMNRPTQAKPPVVISTYDELKSAALDRESEHNHKVERVRRLMMGMTTGTSTGSTISNARILPSPSSNFSSSSSALSSSLTSTLSSTVKPSPKTNALSDEAPNLLKEYEMVEDLRALLPLFSGSVADKSPTPRSRYLTSRSPTSPTVSLLPTLSASVAPTSPVTLNTYSISSLKHALSTSSVHASTGYALTVTNPSPVTFSPPSNTIIEQYHRSIGQSETMNSPRSFHPMSPDGRHPHFESTVPAPPPPRPMRDSFEARVSTEPKTEDELLYEEEIGRHKTGVVITKNPFDAMGLPSTLVFRSKEGTGERKLKPHPPSTLSPSKGNACRRLIQAATRE
jgi:hypothetical protein